MEVRHQQPAQRTQAFQTRTGSDTGNIAKPDNQPTFKGFQGPLNQDTVVTAFKNNPGETAQIAKSLLQKVDEQPPLTEAQADSYGIVLEEALNASLSATVEFSQTAIVKAFSEPVPVATTGGTTARVSRDAMPASKNSSKVMSQAMKHNFLRDTPKASGVGSENASVALRLNDATCSDFSEIFGLDMFDGTEAKFSEPLAQMPGHPGMNVRVTEEDKLIFNLIRDILPGENGEIPKDAAQTLAKKLRVFDEPDQIEILDKMAAKFGDADTVLGAIAKGQEDELLKVLTEASGEPSPVDESPMQAHFMEQFRHGAQLAARLHMAVDGFTPSDHGVSDDTVIGPTAIDAGDPEIEVLPDDNGIAAPSDADPATTLPPAQFDDDDDVPPSLTDVPADVSTDVPTNATTDAPANLTDDPPGIPVGSPTDAGPKDHVAEDLPAPPPSSSPGEATFTPRAPAKDTSIEDIADDQYEYVQNRVDSHLDEMSNVELRTTELKADIEKGLAIQDRMKVLKRRLKRLERKYADSDKGMAMNSTKKQIDNIRGKLVEQSKELKSIQDRGKDIFKSLHDDGTPFSSLPADQRQGISSEDLHSVYTFIKPKKAKKPSPDVSTIPQRSEFDHLKHETHQGLEQLPSLKRRAPFSQQAHHNTEQIKD